MRHIHINASRHVWIHYVAHIHTSCHKGIHDVTYVWKSRQTYTREIKLWLRWAEQRYIVAKHTVVCCSVLQCVCCSVCVAVCCSVRGRKWGSTTLPPGLGCVVSSVLFCCVVLSAGAPIVAYSRSTPVWHDSFICDVTHSFLSVMTHLWHIRAAPLSDMTHPCVTWLIHMWHDSFIRVMTHSFLSDMTPLMHIRAAPLCDMTHSSVTWLIHVWHDSFTSEMTHQYFTWLVHGWVTWLHGILKQHPGVTWLIQMFHMTYS